jgi:hypothetical protein
VLERLTPDYDITVFFYNPNIFPKAEYHKRLTEQERFLEEAHSSVKLMVGDYTPYTPRCCEECFLIRLEETAKTAALHGFDCFTTALTVSSKKKASTINPIAAAVAGRYKVEAILDDFKKKNGYNRSIEISKKYNLYRQVYCGCEPQKTASLTENTKNPTS